MQRRRHSRTARHPHPIRRTVRLVPPHKKAVLGAVVLLVQVERELWLDIAEHRHEWVLRPLAVEVTDLVELLRSTSDCLPHHPIAQLIQLIVVEAHGAGQPLHRALVVPRDVVARLAAHFVLTAHAVALGFWKGGPEYSEPLRRRRTQRT